ncbi:activator of basal transcription 1-like isoform X2 [Daphnia carinata]|uniref:activator of basal transcription 1-like isoform X2 n=1 Tax=Daphnia carinata TaxID=120202 RepID=UPI00257EDF0E|nr:activator of basal transcription 1-like isoform X2 [Daphnia carinata]
MEGKNQLERLDETDNVTDDLMSEEELEDEEIEKPKSRKKPGIVYLSSIPTGMNPQLVREFLGVHGEIGKSFLQPIETGVKKKRSNKFSEGWVEFASKRVAKAVAEHLNNTKVGGKRRTRYHECLWNIKYLPRFKWAHLNERLAYEKAVRQQRMRTEIAQVKRETNFFIESVDKSKRLKKKMDKLEGWSVTQRSTEEEIAQFKTSNQNQDRTEFLRNLFNPSKSSAP